MGSRREVVLLCVGSFNPPTNKHLRIMELARDSLHRTGQYKVVKGILSPVHDSYPKKGLVGAKHRLEMLQLATKSSNWLQVDSWETEQPNWLRTRLVLDELSTRPLEHPPTAEPTVKRRRKAPADTEVSASSIPGAARPTLKLLCGADLLESFAVPNLWSDEDMERIVGHYGLVVITRQGNDPQRFIYESDLLTKYSRNIHLVTDWFNDDFSSTKVRRAIGRNDSIKYVVQDSVVDYIIKNSLYNTNYTPGEPPADQSEREGRVGIMKTSAHSDYFSMEFSSLVASNSSRNANIAECSMSSRSSDSDHDYDTASQLYKTVESPHYQPINYQPFNQSSTSTLTRLQSDPMSRSLIEPQSQWDSNEKITIGVVRSFSFTTPEAPPLRQLDHHYDHLRQVRPKVAGHPVVSRNASYNHAIYSGRKLSNEMKRETQVASEIFSDKSSDSSFSLIAKLTTKVKKLHVGKKKKENS